ncbi:c-type cytochrome [Bacillus kwashiorkori]|uniref:c-type cytochrome n=1 Tax=Bacillus kwashiorkori TaxID=1522318 RepID=UPI001EF030F3|nr:cytochrome c [Bacillus kwashiorkori]
MKKWKLVLAAITVIFMISLVACSNDSTSGPKSNLSPDQLFLQSCASCHGKDFKSGYAPDLDVIGSKYTSEEIEKIILNGKGQMRGGFLKGEDAKKVAEWLAEKK